MTVVCVRGLAHLTLDLAQPCFMGFILVIVEEHEINHKIQ